ncbi:MAG: AlkZ family DNA glycosylase [Anaerolineales bacterium]|nr:AlkZ family DNA glycosylase [Anaerolineales bacterium]MCB9128141.1 AlkZ family DNA glycosylase [Ardenticatenales bacterium]
MPLTLEQVRWFRLQRSGLIEPFERATEVARALVGVQAQILPAAGLSLWNRLPALSHDSYERLLFEERTLVKLWGQRGTLHLYASDEWPLIHAANAVRNRWWERHAEDAAAYAKAADAVGALIEERGTLGRSDLRESEIALEDHHFSAWGGIFAELVRRGVACHGPAEGGEGRFMARSHWLPELEWAPPDGDEANVKLARRFFAAYGPATVQDFAYWRGWYVAACKRWLAALGDDLVEVTVDGAPMLALRDDLDALRRTPPPHDAWPVRMLYRFDPLLLAVKDKSWLVDDAHYKRIWRPAGHIEGTIIDHGRAVATWRYQRKSSGLSIGVSPFAPLPTHVQRAVEGQAQAIAAFFGLPLQEITVDSVGRHAVASAVE